MINLYPIFLFILHNKKAIDDLVFTYLSIYISKIYISRYFYIYVSGYLSILNYVIQS